MNLLHTNDLSNRTKIHAALQKIGITIWLWPDEDAVPNSRGEISIFRIHVNIPGQQEIVSPKIYHGTKAASKGVVRIVDALYTKYILK